MSKLKISQLSPKIKGRYQHRNPIFDLLYMIHWSTMTTSLSTRLYQYLWYHFIQVTYSSLKQQIYSWVSYDTRCASNLAGQGYFEVETKHKSHEFGKFESPSRHDPGWGWQWDTNSCFMLKSHICLVSHPFHPSQSHNINICRLWTFA